MIVMVLLMVVGMVVEGRFRTIENGVFMYMYLYISIYKEEELIVVFGMIGGGCVCCSRTIGIVYALQ